MRAGGDHITAADEAARARLSNINQLSPTQAESLAKFIVVDIMIPRGSYQEAKAFAEESSFLSLENKQAMMNFTDDRKILLESRNSIYGPSGDLC